MNAIVGPNGQPVQKTVTITHEAVLVIAGQLIQVEINHLLALGITPPVLAENLLKIVANLLAPAEPTQARNALVDQLVAGLKKDVYTKAGERMLAQAVARGAAV